MQLSQAYGNASVHDQAHNRRHAIGPVCKNWNSSRIRGDCTNLFVVCDNSNTDATSVLGNDGVTDHVVSNGEDTNVHASVC